MSQRVLKVDPRTGRALTNSGLVYQLIGPPGSYSESEYTWSLWKAAAKASEDQDLTEDLYRDFVCAAGPFLSEMAEAGGASADERLERELERRVLALIWSGTEWLSPRQIRHRSADRGPSAARLAAWEDSRAIFSVQAAGERRYALYAFEPDFAPRPVIGDIIRILSPLSAFGLAAFFEGTSAFLNGRRPRELVAIEDQAVIAAAMHKRDAEEFCG